ncbi:MAG: choice-of-anchor D domain-containing protein [Solirubrobacterales bacterium]|nr:choice-of-anchor D domain-containing protein [Solirubrobacterales bacterium]
MLITASAASAAGGVTVLTPSLNFGRAVLGSTNTVTKQVTLQNGTSSTLQLNSMQLTGAVSDFVPSFSNGTTCPTPEAGASAGVAPGASCTVTVTYTPSTLGPVSAQLNMTFCAAGETPCTPITTSDVSLAADGVNAETLTLSPTPLTFTATSLDTSSASQTVTLTNGPEEMSITGLSLGGAAPGDFVIGRDGCSGTDLAPGASCTFGVTFAPSQAGERDATVTVSGATVGNTYPTLALSGLGDGSNPDGTTGAGLPPTTTTTTTTPTTTTPTTTAVTLIPSGQPGATGSPGQVWLVTCKPLTSAQRRNGKTQQCTAKRVVGSVTFTAGAAKTRATISRGRVVYGTGSATSRGARGWQLVINARRALRSGMYTLTLRTGRGPARRVSLTLT